jgi:hypothetical protein
MHRRALSCSDVHRFSWTSTFQEDYVELVMADPRAESLRALMSPSTYLLKLSFRKSGSSGVGVTRLFPAFSGDALSFRIVYHSRACQSMPLREHSTLNEFVKFRIHPILIQRPSPAKDLQESCVIKLVTRSDFVITSIMAIPYHFGIKGVSFCSSRYDVSSWNVAPRLDRVSCGRVPVARRILCSPERTRTIQRCTAAME